MPTVQSDGGGNGQRKDKLCSRIRRRNSVKMPRVCLHRHLSMSQQGGLNTGGLSSNVSADEKVLQNEAKRIIHQVRKHCLSTVSQTAGAGGMMDI